MTALATVLLSLPVLYATYVITLVAYRLLFHPLSKYPGPKLAAATLWYEFYYDVLQQGRWSFKISELHKKYGPIIRINPHELHICDPHAFEDIYGNRTQDRYDWWTTGGDIEDSAFMTVPHEHHRLRRKAFAPFFTKSSMMSRINSILAGIDKLRSRLEESAGQDQPVRLDLAFQALSNDIMMDLFFGKSMNFLDSPDFAEEWNDISIQNMRFFPITRHFPGILSMMGKMPTRILSLLTPGVHMQLGFRNFLRSRVDEVKEEYTSNMEKRLALRQRKDLNERTQQRTVFHTILDSDLQPSEKSAVRLEREALVLLSAGVGPVARGLSLIVTHVLLDPSHKMLSNLVSELRTVMPSPDVLPSLQTLERLPYLTAIIKESIRLDTAVSTRTPRVFREPFEYYQYIIPAGTPISQTLNDILYDERFFPYPKEFRPERWLRKNEETDAWELHNTLDKWLVSFGKGTRQCAGIHLAWMELYFTVSMLFRRFEFELFETDVSDVEYYHDFFAPHPRLTSRGVRAKVVGMHD